MSTRFVYFFQKIVTYTTSGIDKERAQYKTQVVAWVETFL
jgi:hypothetical protein